MAMGEMRMAGGGWDKCAFLQENVNHDAPEIKRSDDVILFFSFLGDASDVRPGAGH